MLGTVIHIYSQTTVIFVLPFNHHWGSQFQAISVLLVKPHCACCLNFCSWRQTDYIALPVFSVQSKWILWFFDTHGPVFPISTSEPPCALFNCFPPFILGICLRGPSWPGPWLSQVHLRSCCLCLFLAQTCSPVSSLWQMIWPSCKKERLKSAHDFRGPWLLGRLCVL